MKKKVTNEDVAQTIKDLADKITAEVDSEIRVASSHLVLAEKELVESFSAAQKQLYVEYIMAKQRYYDVVTSKYKALK